MDLHYDTSSPWHYIAAGLVAIGLFVFFRERDKIQMRKSKQETAFDRLDRNRTWGLLFAGIVLVLGGIYQLLNPE